MNEAYFRHSNKFSLYCSRTEIINKKGTFLGYSPLFRMKPSIRNALVQSLAEVIQ